MKIQVKKWLIVIATLVSLMFVVTGLEAKKTDGGTVGDLNCKECVDASDIAKSAVTNSKIKKGAVSNSKLGRDAVSNSKIQDGAVNTDKLAAWSVSTDKLGTHSVTKGKLAAGAVTTWSIEDGAVTVSKVAPELRNAIGTSCPAGEFVVGMDANGYFVCESKVVQVLDPDLTGKTYCLIAQGIELVAEGGLSAQVELNPIHTRMDFTSPTQVTVMDIAGPLASLNFPSYTMSDRGDFQVSEGTYTMVGSQLAVTVDDPDPEDDEPEGSVTLFLTLTPDGQAFIGSLTWWGVEEGYVAFGNHILMGVQADSCD